jgi:hypothetical protein
MENGKWRHWLIPLKYPFSLIIHYSFLIVNYFPPFSIFPQNPSCKMIHILQKNTPFLKICIFLRHLIQFCKL